MTSPDIHALGGAYVLDAVDDGLLAEVTAKGEYLKSRLAALAPAHLTDFRGVGLMVGATVEGAQVGDLAGKLGEHLSNVVGRARKRDRVGVPAAARLVLEIFTELQGELLNLCHGALSVKSSAVRGPLSAPAGVVPVRGPCF